jgi:hypothetical protein
LGAIFFFFSKVPLSCAYPRASLLTHSQATFSLSRMIFSRMTGRSSSR